jgi:hypothetical protein
MGCTANVLVDSIALRKLISAESRAVAERVNRTFLLGDGKQSPSNFDTFETTYIGEPE